VQLRLDDPLVQALARPIDPASRVPLPTGPRVVFVCTHNSARSQLAAASWARVSEIPVACAGTHPAPRVHPGAVAAGRRHGLRLGRARTAHIDEVVQPADLVVAVCDSAHEELDPARPRLHWSIPDPVRVGTDAAFDAACDEIDRRVRTLAAD
jgi:protein-tyrosine-phosphatase